VKFCAWDEIINERLIDQASQEEELSDVLNCSENMIDVAIRPEMWYSCVLSRSLPSMTQSHSIGNFARNCVTISPHATKSLLISLCYFSPAPFAAFPDIANVRENRLRENANHDP